jgi:predicted membrane channel-forming protein YqfA (hemolysin III family)
MKLTPPTKLAFWISVVLAALGLIGQLGLFAALAPFSFWLVFVGFVVLLIGLLVKGF